MDDRVRAEVYNRIYTQPALRKYNANQGSLGCAIGPGARIAFMQANSAPGAFSVNNDLVVQGQNLSREPE